MPAAQAEIIGAQDWYERETKGLGARFRLEIESQVQRIATNPLQFRSYCAMYTARGCGAFLTVYFFGRLTT